VKGPGLARAPLLALACCALATGPRGQVPETGAGESSPRPPDVLLIVLDDVNDWVGYLGGHPGVHTPAIDGLAARGLGFTNAHCPSPVCRPSRTALLSGMRACHLPGGPNTLWTDLIEVERTLPAWFGAHGYRVAGCGKVFHLQNELAFDEYFDGENDFPGPERSLGAEYGLDDDDDDEEEEPAKFSDAETDILNDEHFDWGAIDTDEFHWRDHQNATWAAERLSEDSDQPLFLAIGIGKPHLPWYFPASYFDLYPLEDVELPDVRVGDRADLPREARNLVHSGRVHAKLVEADLWCEAVRAYLAGVSFADAQVGLVLAALEASPRRDRTIVALVSDHGWHLGEKGHWRKATLWERSTHIPLVIATPGYQLPGATCGRPVESLSIYPTLCDLAGLPRPEQIEAPSLVPLLADPAAEWSHLALTSLRDSHTLRSERYRFTRYRAGSIELYDHELDPHEYDNRADDPELEDERRKLGRRLDLLLAPRRR